MTYDDVVLDTLVPDDACFDLNELIDDGEGGLQVVEVAFLVEAFLDLLVDKLGKLPLDLVVVLSTVDEGDAFVDTVGCSGPYILSVVFECLKYQGYVVSRVYKLVECDNGHLLAELFDDQDSCIALHFFGLRVLVML